MVEDSAAVRAGRLVGRALRPRTLLILAIAVALIAGAGVVVVSLGGGYEGPRFDEVSMQAGLDYVQDSSTDCGDWQECGPEIMSGGAAAGDFDRDGDLDLAVTRIDKPPILYSNRGDGTFEDVSSHSGIGGPSAPLGTSGVAFGDLDRNGCPDIYMTRVRKAHHVLFMNDCNGHFTEEALVRNATPVAEDTNVFGQGVTLGDYDRDGYLDVFVSEWRFKKPGVEGRSHNRLLRNIGALAPGHFEDTTERAGIVFEGRSPLGGHNGIFGFAPAFVDLDGDGFQDLAVAADFGSSGLWWNDRDGTFSDGTKPSGVGSDENGMGSTFGDFDLDGRMDWFVTSIYDDCMPGRCDHMFGITGNRLYRNEGNRSFSDWTDRSNVRDGAWGWGAAFFDVDNDSDLDIAHTSGFHVVGEERYDKFRSNPTFLQLNDGLGRYAEVAGDAGVRETVEGRGLLTFDYDDDGDLDLLVVQRRDRPRLFRNNGPSKPWLKIRLHGSGPVSTTEATGARVEVVSAEAKAPMIREVGMRDNYLGQDPSELHFGLGATKKGVYQVSVSWPSGCKQTLRDVAKNETLELDEAACRA